MKFPKILLSVLIIISLFLAGYAAYALYAAQVIAKPSAEDAMAQALDAMPLAPAASGEIVPAKGK